MSIALFIIFSVKWDPHIDMPNYAFSVHHHHHLYHILCDHNDDNHNN